MCQKVIRGALANKGILDSSKRKSKSLGGAMPQKQPLYLFIIYGVAVPAIPWGAVSRPQTLGRNLAAKKGSQACQCYPRNSIPSPSFSSLSVEFRGFRAHVTATRSSAPILYFYSTLHLAAAYITNGTLPRGVGAAVRQKVDV
jgi:hypothetical protein